MRLEKALYISFSILILSSCKYDVENEDLLTSIQEPVIELPVPDGFPPIAFPEDNHPTASRIELGKLLFHDERLSRDGSVSCASCHLQENAFADPMALSEGIDGQLSMRNSPTLANLAWQPHLFMDGGVPTLELQVLAPIENPVEMDHSITAAAQDLNSDPQLRELALKAYNRELDPYVVTRALSNYQRTLISGESKYDQYLEGNVALSEQELQGMELFFSDEVACASCHSGVFFSDFSFQNIGLYQEYEDNGRERVTANPDDNGKFKVPTLRNVAVTQPYMHDGSIQTLEEVIDFFNEGGFDHANKAESVQALGLNEEEKAALLSFLNTLTDDRFLTNPEH